MNEVKLREFMQVEYPRSKPSNQDVGRFVVGSSGQVVELSLLVEEMSRCAEQKLFQFFRKKNE